MSDIDIITNAADIAIKWVRRRKRLNDAIYRGLRKAAAAVDREQVKNLSGSGAAAPGSYPIPVRTGNLRGSHFFEVHSTRLAIVGNTAEYAHAVHEGEGSSADYSARPFLDDAADAVDAVEVMAVEVRREVFAI